MLGNLAAAKFTSVLTSSGWDNVNIQSGVALSALDGCNTVHTRVSGNDAK